MLEFLDRSASDDLAIQIEPDDPTGPRFAGDLVKATIRVQSSKEVHVREVRAGLVRWERFQVTEHRRRSKGGSTSRKVWRTEEEWVARQTLAEEGTLQDGYSRGFRVEFQVPANPAPPGAGTISQLRWMLKVTADCPRARDANAEHTIRLLVPAPSDLRAEGAFGQPSAPEAAYMQFQLTGLTTAAGETLNGRLVVAPIKDVGGRRLRVDLVRDETVTAGDRPNEVSETVATQDVANDVRLIAGEQTTYDFAIQVPAEACPSRQTAFSQVRWKLKGVLDRALRSDYRVEQELLIANGPPR